MVLVSTMIAKIQENLMQIVMTGLLILIVAIAGYQVGYTKHAEKTALEQNESLQKYVKESEALRNQIDELNARQPKEVIKLVEVYKENESKSEDEYKAVIERVTSDNFRLRVNLRNAEARAATAGVTASAIGTYAAVRAELSEEDTRFLLSEARRADAVVNRFNFCVQRLEQTYDYIHEYRESIKKFYKDHGYAGQPLLDDEVRMALAGYQF